MLQRYGEFLNMQGKWEKSFGENKNWMGFGSVGEQAFILPHPQNQNERTPYRANCASRYEGRSSDDDMEPDLIKIAFRSAKV
jgi:hypothetical protein